MYSIMITKSVRDNYETLYQFLTTTNDDDETVILEIETKDELDEKVESMLNDEGYAKADFVIVEVIDYMIDATSYSDDEDDTTEESDTDDTTSDDESSDESSEE